MKKSDYIGGYHMLDLLQDNLLVLYSLGVGVRVEGAHVIFFTRFHDYQLKTHLRTIFSDGINKTISSLTQLYTSRYMHVPVSADELMLPEACLGSMTDKEWVGEIKVWLKKQEKWNSIKDNKKLSYAEKQNLLYRLNNERLIENV